MSQQEFESPERRGYRARRRSDRASQWEEGMPKDEPPGAYSAPSGQFESGDYQGYRTRQSSVPWWARPQPQPFSSSGFIGVVVIVFLVLLALGALGIAGMILGALAHIIGIIIGAIFALLIFVFVLVMLMLMIIRRAIGNVTGYNRRAGRRGRRLWSGPW